MRVKSKVTAASQHLGLSIAQKWTPNTYYVPRHSQAPPSCPKGALKPTNPFSCQQLLCESLFDYFTLTSDSGSPAVAMFNALNRFMSRLDGDPSQQRQQERGSFGFQVLRNTNLELAIEPWFDFVVGINGRPIVCLTGLSRLTARLIDLGYFRLRPLCPRDSQLCWR